MLKDVMGIQSVKRPCFLSKIAMKKVTDGEQIKTD
jgi:hypothetical protein